MSPENRRDIYDSIAWYTLVALAFIVPISFGQINILGTVHIITDGIVDFVKAFVVISGTVVASTAWGMGALWRGTTIRYANSQIVLLLFVVWVTLCAVVSPYTPSAFTGVEPTYQGVIMWMCYCILMALTMQYVRGIKEIRQLLTAFSCSAALVSLYGIAQWLDYEFFRWESLTFSRNRSFSFYGNPDMLGGFLSLAFFIALGLALTEKNEKLKVINWSVLSLIAVCLTSSFTRGAWLGVIVGSVTFTVLFIYKKGNTEKGMMYGIAAVFCSMFFVFLRSLSSPGSDTNAAERVTSIVSDRNVVSRFDIWRSVLNAIKDAPLFGYGTDTYSYSSALYKTQAMHLATPFVVESNAHNFVLQTALETGIPGVLLILGFLIAASITTLQWILGSKDISRSRTLFLALWCGCLSYGVYLMSGVSIPGTTYFFFMVIGILVAPLARSFQIKPQRFATIPLILLALMVSGGLIQILRADMAFVQTRLGSDLESRLEAAKRTVDLNPVFYKYRYQLAWLNYDMGDRYANEYLDDQTAGSALLQQAAVSSLMTSASEFEQLIARFPGFYAPHIYLATTHNRLAEISGDLSWTLTAIDSARNAIALQSFDSGGNAEIARAYLNQGNYTTALEYAIRATVVNPANENAQQLVDYLEKAMTLSKEQAQPK